MLKREGRGSMLWIVVAEGGGRRVIAVRMLLL
jgi:hypothetical protein